MLRCLLIEAAWIAIRKDPAMTVSYTEYRKRMNPQKSIVKIARRLVNRIYYVLKHEKTEYTMYSNMKRNIYRVLSNDTESYKVKQLSFEGNTIIFMRL